MSFVSILTLTDVEYTSKTGKTLVKSGVVIHDLPYSEYKVLLLMKAVEPIKDSPLPQVSRRQRSKE